MCSQDKKGMTCIKNQSKKELQYLDRRQKISNFAADLVL